MYVIGNYKQLGDQNFKKNNNYPLQPPKNDYTWFVRSKASDTPNVTGVFIQKVDGKNKDLKYGYSQFRKQQAYTDLNCNGREGYADRRVGLINLVSWQSSGTDKWPWSCCYDQNRIPEGFIENKLQGNIDHNLKKQTGGRRKTRKRRKRKGGRRKTRKNKRKTRRKSKKRRRRTRRRKRR